MSELDPQMLIGLGESIEKWRHAKQDIQSFTTITGMQAIAKALRRSCGLCRFQRSQKPMLICGSCPWVHRFKRKCTFEPWYVRLSQYKITLFIKFLLEGKVKVERLRAYMIDICNEVIRALYLIKEHLDIATYSEKAFIKLHAPCIEQQEEAEQ